MNPLHWLPPWEFSSSVMVCCTAAVILFARGSRRESGCAATTSRWREVSFYLGVMLIYVPLQTGFDYFAQHMFWIHRLQHLLLHHIGPFLVALSAPWSSMSRGLPETWRDPVITVMRSTPIRGLYGILQQPLSTFALFVGLIYFWLWPSVHFRAMLSADEYQTAAPSSSPAQLLPSKAFPRLASIAPAKQPSVPLSAPGRWSSRTARSARTSSVPARSIRRSWRRFRSRPLPKSLPASRWVAWVARMKLPKWPFFWPRTTRVLLPASNCSWMAVRRRSDE
jgi:Cytochrome c oxidase caa3 assembly factor (Caa3_CtaG)